MRNLLL